MASKLSVIIPVYNEERSISRVLNEVMNAKTSIKKEIIIVDDGSTDNTKEAISNFIKNKGKNSDIHLFSKENGGKGSAVKMGIKKATGNIIIIQDADLEYNPQEYQSLINPILNNECKVVYGSRSLKKSNRMSTLSFYMGGKLVTLVTNILFFSNLTDEPTCYKVFKTDLIKNIEIKGDRFEWEPEVTAKILKKGIKIKEIPISYTPRSIKEGKKIKWRDGLQAIWTLIKYRFKE